MPYREYDQGGDAEPEPVVAKVWESRVNRSRRLKHAFRRFAAIPKKTLDSAPLSELAAVVTDSDAQRPQAAALGADSGALCVEISPGLARTLS
ncbi:hypothetical protein CYMTET_10629 [Cymbomonas tetramitiformis]|uniref:Uncharacterized protein n=1 Tax=Cymbomonas tetramitiformis TaxID=36881 RepID=A0AAE0GP14_9CHLO|nr:hypothetical protein CYMTET_10629 [Cymbomonas tetramitiformis]